MAAIARVKTMHMCSSVQVHNKVYMAWCEGMLAERISKIACSCGLIHLGPFSQVQALARLDCFCIKAMAAQAWPHMQTPNPSTRCRGLEKQDKA